MNLLIKSMLVLVLHAPFFVMSQQTIQPDSLLNKLTGKWVLRGTIAGQETTHDMEGKRVLSGQYLQLKEVSREKDVKGLPIYDALVYICWQEAKKEYFCLWLDNTSNEGISNQVIARAPRNGNKIEFLFSFKDSTQFHTTFFYDPGEDSWQWIMDGEENGKLKPFARLILTKN